MHWKRNVQFFMFASSLEWPQAVVQGNSIAKWRVLHDRSGQRSVHNSRRYGDCVKIQIHIHIHMSVVHQFRFHCVWPRSVRIYYSFTIGTVRRFALDSNRRFSKRFNGAANSQLLCFYVINFIIFQRFRFRFSVYTWRCLCPIESIRFTTTMTGVMSVWW